MAEQSDPIRDYIRAHRDRYTRESITQQLMEAGHDKARIDEAWQVLVEAGSLPDERTRNPRLVAFVLLAYGLGFVALLWIGGLRFEHWLLAYAVVGGVSAFLLVRLRVSGLRWVLVVPMVSLFFGAVWYGTCMATWYIRCDGHISIYC